LLNSHDYACGKSGATSNDAGKCRIGPVLRLRRTGGVQIYADAADKLRIRTQRPG
jgi:hypothetical protein